MKTFACVQSNTSAFYLKFFHYLGHSIKYAQTMQFFTEADIHKYLNFPDLIEELRLGFQQDITVPPRLHYDFPNPKNRVDNTLLLMPAWQAGRHLGVKLVTVAPANSNYKLNAVQGIYILSDAITGENIAIMDAKSLTNWRTACASALASSYLSMKNSQTLLMVGAGALAPYLIQAHASVRPIQHVLIWNRNDDKAKQLAEQINRDTALNTQVAHNLEDAVSYADIISCATLSETPLIQGNWLHQGQHLDLVGSFKPTMREADDETIRKSHVYTDILEMAPKESGDLFIPIQNKVLALKDIKGDLFDLCTGNVKGRTNDDEITVFKSVGHALEDLVAAQLVLKNLKQTQQRAWLS